jgi:hypothetical protein
MGKYLPRRFSDFLRACHLPEEVIGFIIMFDQKAAFAVLNTTTTTRLRHLSARIPASP